MLKLAAVRAPRHRHPTQGHHRNHSVAHYELIPVSSSSRSLRSSCRPSSPNSSTSTKSILSRKALASSGSPIRPSQSPSEPISGSSAPAVEAYSNLAIIGSTLSGGRERGSAPDLDEAVRLAGPVCEQFLGLGRQEVQGIPRRRPTPFSAVDDDRHDEGVLADGRIPRANLSDDVNNTLHIVRYA